MTDAEFEEWATAQEANAARYKHAYDLLDAERPDKVENQDGEIRIYYGHILAWPGMPKWRIQNTLLDQSFDLGMQILNARISRATAKAKRMNERYCPRCGSDTGKGEA